MSFFKLVRFAFVFLLVIGLCEVGYSQACNGFDGTPRTGGLANNSNGEICVNKIGAPALLEIKVGNVNDPFGVVEFEINRDDGTPPYRIPATPDVLAHSYKNIEAINFLPGKCEYFPSVKFFVGGTDCGPVGTPPPFVRWNSDNMPSGLLDLVETINGANEYLVCEGTETTITFTDRSTLNCVPPDLTNNINQSRRWRQFVYGTATTITGTVLVNGLSPGFPFFDIVNQSTNPPVPPFPITSPTDIPGFETYSITVPATARDGEIFQLTMNYWNYCNPYTGVGEVPVSINATIRIVKQPPAPDPVSHVVCNGTSLPDFSITNLGTVSSQVLWFEDNGGVPGNVIVNSNGNNSQNLPASNYPGGISNTVPDEYKVWASYKGIVNADNETCESPRIPVTLTIRENLPIIPPPFTGYSNQICRDDPMTITLPILVPETFGGATEYVWSVTGGAGVTFGTTANSATFDFTGVAIGGTSANRTIRVIKRYTNGLGCPSPNRDLPIQIFAPSIGGALSAVPDICETSPVGTINLTGERGTVQRWEVSFNNGPFLPNAALGTSTSISPGIVTPGNYQYRAIVANGTCAEVPSTIEALDVFPNPVAASVGSIQQFCGAILNSDPLGGNNPSAGTGIWSIFSRPATSTATAANFIDATQGNTVFNGDVFGVYILRWTITSGTCVSSDDIEVDFGTDPGPQDAGVAGPFCTLTLSGALNAAAPPTVGTGQWSLAPGLQPGTAIFADDLDRNTVVTVSNFGTYTFRWIVTSGICLPPRSADAVVRFTQPATASVPPDFTICVDQTLLAPIDLTGTNLIGGGATDGQWQIVSGAGRIQSTGGITGSSVNNSTSYLDHYIPTAGETTVKLRMVAQHPDLAACPNVNSADLTITIDRKPAAAVAGTNFSVCDGTPAALSATPATNGGSGQWSYVSGPDNTPVFDDDTDATTNVQVSLSGIYQYRWTVNSAMSVLPPPTVGECAATSAVVQVDVRALPVNNLTTPEICQTEPVLPEAHNVDLSTYDGGVINPAAAADREVKWYATLSNRDNDIFPIVAPVDITPSNNIWYTRVIDTTIPPTPALLCENLGSVVFTINPKPNAFDQGIQLCEDFPVGSGISNDVDLTNYEDGTTDLLTTERTITWHTTVLDAESGNAPILDPTDIDLTADAFYFARVVNADGCFRTARLDLHINSRPPDQTIIGSQTPCTGSQVLYRVNHVSGAQYAWDISPTFTVLGGGGVGDFYVLLEFPNTTTGDIKVTVSQNGCAGNEITKNVQPADAPTGYTIDGPTAACEGVTLEYKVDPDNTGSSTYNWQVYDKATGLIGGGIVASGQTTGTVLINFLNKDVFIKVTESNSANCQSNNPPTLDVDVNLNPVIAATISEVCSDAPIDIEVVSADPLLPAVDKIVVVADPSVYPGLVSKVKTPAGEYLPDALQNDIYENLTIGLSLPVVYRIRPKSIENCVGDEKNITVNIKAEPALDPTPLPSVCSESPVTSLLKSALGFLAADKFLIESVTYDPALIEDPGNTIILNQLLDNDAVSAHVWKNLTIVPQIVKYKIRPYSLVTNCYGDPAVDIQVTILPKPQLFIGTNDPICSRDQLNISLTSDIGGATFEWTVTAADPNITGYTGGTTNSITDQLFNTTLAPGSVTYTVKASNPNFTPVCVSTPTPVVVQVKPSPNVVTPLDKITCSDDFGGNTSKQNLTLLHPEISTEPGVTYTWFTDENDSTGSKIPLSEITAYTLTDEVPIFALVRNPAASSGCTKVATVTFDVRPTPELTVDPMETADNRFNITCNGLSNGQVAVSAQFGTNHTFSLDGGAFVPTILFSSLNAGSHNIRTRNSENCFDETDVILLQPDPIVIDAPTVVDVSCFNDPAPDGEITITATGGTSMTGGDPLLFSLLQDPTIVYDASTQTFSGLRASTYTVRVADKNGCTKFEPNIVVGQPTDLSLAIEISSDYNGFDVSCNGQTDGEISVLTTAGGTGPYHYFLLDENMNDTGNNSGFTLGVFTQLSANILYTVKVTDDKGCEKNSIPELLFDPVPLNPGAIGFDKDICEGGDPTPFVQLAPPFGGIDGATDTYGYNWLESSDNITFVDAAGVRDQKTYDPPILTSQMFYKRSVTSGTCVAVESNVFKVVVHTKPTATLTAPSEVCEGQTFTLDFAFANGQAPYFFDYNDGVNTYNLIGAESRPVPISNYTSTKVFTLTHVRDFYGCEPDAYPVPVSPRMINMNNVFSVNPNLAECSGGNFTFSYTRYPDVEYVWSFNDGSVDRIIPAFSGVTTIADTVQHIFRSVNVSGDTKYPVTLKARSTIPSTNCESQSLPQNVTISPTIFINAVIDRDEICSGETINIINATLGGNDHRWSYRPKLNPADVVSMVNTTTATSFPYTFINSTPDSIEYEIVYHVSNGSCSDEVVLPITVHRAIAASFDTLSVTKYIGGNAFANFINTSVPQDPVDFQYEWQFDAGSIPITFDGPTPPQIRYNSIGEKNVSLKVTNLVAEAKGLTCISEAEMTIYILLPDLFADFEYTPQATCFPSDIEITKNLGTGNIFEWRLREFNESTPLLVSNDSLPTFRITFPGVYVIEFKTTNTITGQTAEADNVDTPIEIFDVPFAGFEARPKTIYVPDEELITTNRSTDANQYEWDFGDGEKSEDYEPRHIYGLAGKYSVVLVAGFNHGAKDFDGDGITDGNLVCYDTARQEITAKEGGLTRIPNAFTPNTAGPNGGVSSGGSFNDVFIPITKGVEEFEMTIFDRWGVLIFQSKDKNIGWDGYDKNGVLMPAGVYVYKLTMRLSNDQRTTQVGDVTLIR